MTSTPVKKGFFKLPILKMLLAGLSQKTATAAPPVNPADPVIIVL
jgi:hypothetical protein